MSAYGYLDSPPEPRDEQEYDCGCTAVIWHRRGDWEVGARCEEHATGPHPCEDERTWEDEMADRADAARDEPPDDDRGP